LEKALRQVVTDPNADVLLAETEHKFLRALMRVAEHNDEGEQDAYQEPGPDPAADA
jgi:hypothetical protein